MYPEQVRRQALRLRSDGLSWSEVSRQLGVARSTLRAWTSPAPPRQIAADCWVCHPDRHPDASAYGALLGYYLGDGHISRHPRYFCLRVSCDAKYPLVVSDVLAVIERVHPAGRRFTTNPEGCVVVVSDWQHWPCLFPQHGPGRKHERPIVLEAWQEALVRAEPGAFLRGLFHSDGSRVRNWATREVDGEKRRYEYPRWQFTNVSGDILHLCGWALDLVDIPWRQSNWNCLSVSRRDAVAALDVLIGLKA